MIVVAMLPLIRRAFRLHPAKVLAPAVATLVEVSGLAICLSIMKYLCWKFWVNNVVFK